MNTLTIGSLFSGIGGIDLGLERAGMKVKWHSEIDPYACRVLKKHWPDVPNLGDITTVNWENVPYVDVIAGGYPCQPFSLAGRRNGEHDPRHLWPYFRDAISVLRPRYALLENVRGHLTLGGLSVIGDLAAIGYDAEWRIVSAASVGANHRRDRLIIVAYPRPQFGGDVAYGNDSGSHDEICPRRDAFGHGSSSVAYPDDKGLQGRHSPSNTRRQNTERHIGSGSPHLAYANVRQTCGRLGCQKTDTNLVFGGENFRRGTAGYGGREWWQVEPDVGRVADGIPARVDRLRGLGNAVVPQVAEVVGRLIMEHANG